MYSDERIYQIALTLIEGVGDVNAKSLLAYCGSASEVFKQKKGTLLKIPGIGEYTAKSVVASKDIFLRAEKELKFIEKHKISLLFFTNSDYPNRLKYCSDGPILLYYKGNANLNASKIVSVVGSRKPSDYGKHITESFISELSETNVLVVSGLAYGVDVCAHKASLNNNLQTVGVLAHGLDRIYPQQHTNIAKKMVSYGGLLTDFMSETNPDAVNFPKRNRIVAGLCDALVVVESKRKGGSLITATIANSYNKDVFAFPGRANDELSEGCNGLIKQNRATLVENAADLLFAMQWEEVTVNRTKTAQVPLLINLTAEEQIITTAFKTKNPLQIDELCYLSNMPVSKVAGLLLQLEFNNLIKSKPGKLYEFIGGNL
jgi:DNA processing protein